LRQNKTEFANPTLHQTPESPAVPAGAGGCAGELNVQIKIFKDIGTMTNNPKKANSLAVAGFLAPFVAAGILNLSQLIIPPSTPFKIKHDTYMVVPPPRPSTYCGLA